MAIYKIQTKRSEHGMSPTKYLFLHLQKLNKFQGREGEIKQKMQEDFTRSQRFIRLRFLKSNFRAEIYYQTMNVVTLKQEPKYTVSWDKYLEQLLVLNTVIISASVLIWGFGRGPQPLPWYCSCHDLWGHGTADWPCSWCHLLYIKKIERFKVLLLGTLLTYLQAMTWNQSVWSDEEILL